MRRKKDLTKRNTASVPSAAFTAPQPVRTTRLGGSSKVLNSSLLGRPTLPPSAQDDEPFSDPESSLYDYQVMGDAGYSSVMMLSESRQSPSIGEREQSREPQQREHDIDEHQQAHLDQALESPRIHKNSKALYSKPLKRAQRAVSSQTMHATQEVRDAMQQVHDLYLDEGPGPSNRTKRNTGPVPSAAFAAVPRTPALQPVSTTRLGGSSKVLNSSLPPSAQDDEPFSDPESSLYDYQVMEDAGYSSVVMLSESRQSPSIGEREQAREPQQREHDIDEHQQAHLDQALKSPRIHKNPKALYSMPLKRAQRAVSSKTVHATQEVRDAMQQVHDLYLDKGPGPSNRRRTLSSKKSSSRKPKKQMSAKS